MGRLINYKVFLILIVLLAFLLRFYKVTEIPPSLNWDEVSIGYNAYSVLKTGRDEWGQVLPLHFRSYGEYKLPVQIYFSIPGVLVFGLNELGVRITPVMYGTLTVLVLYFLTKELFSSKGNKNVIFSNELIALISSFFLAVSPWHIHLTRASFESGFSVFWVLLGTWLMIKGFKDQKWWMFSVIAFIVGIYTYNSARVFIPIFVVAAFLLYRKEFLVDKKRLVISGALFFALLVPLIPFTLSGEVASRYKLVSILDDPGLIPRIDEARNLSTLPPTLTTLIHNRVTYTSVYFASNYLAHFSPDYLFISGAPHKQHHVQGVGQMYLIQAPFVLLGVYFLFKNNVKYRWLLISWLLLAFIPVSVTRDSIPHALRTVIAAPVYQILTAYGLILGISLARSKASLRVFLSLVILAFGANFLSYLNNYYTIYPKLFSRDWQYGYSEVVSYIKDRYDDYDQIIFSRSYGEPHMFTLFFLNWDPLRYQDDPNLVRFKAYDWVWVTNFDKFYFPDLGDEGTKYADLVGRYKDKKVLLIGKPGDFPDDVRKLKEVSFKNGKEAFEIVEYR